MNVNILVMTNILCPLLSGIPLLCFAVYFFYASQGLFRQKARLFPLFLLAFSLYILGRPVQLLVGPYPWPVIVNALRMILFAGICCPLVLHEARSLCDAQDRRTRLRPLFAIGGALAALYVVLMAVGPTYTPILFELGHLKAYDCTSTVLTPPLFAREITIMIQMLAGVGFFGLAGYETLKARKALRTSKRDSRHLLYFALGCLIFGAAIVIGNLTKQWWFYYLASVPSTFFIGLGVREDMLYVRRRTERVTPFLRDELFHAFGSGPEQQAQVQDLKNLLGKEVSPTLVMAIRPSKLADTGEAWLKDQELTRNHLAKLLNDELGPPHYLLLSIGAGSFAICLDKPEDTARALASKLRARLSKNRPTDGMASGIGRTHPPQELQHSYLEAQTALRAAEASNQPIVSYIDLGTLPTQRRYPVEARDAFLLEFKHAHQDATHRRLQILFDQMTIHANGDTQLYRVRLQELLGILLSQISESCDNAAPILTEGAAAFEKLGRAKEIEELTRTFAKTIECLLTHIKAPSIETSTVNHLERAKAYIKENLEEDLKVAEVARHAGVRTQQLQQIFKDALNMTYSTYLTTVRLHKAKELLAGSDRSITEIAFDVGYNDSNYFSTTFSKHEGISPRQYRKGN